MTYYIVLIANKYKVIDTASSNDEAAEKLKSHKRPGRCLVVRDGSTGRRYAYAVFLEPILKTRADKSYDEEAA